MRKSFKKGMAMVLAAAMVFSTPVAVNKTAVKAAAEPTVVTESSDTEDVVTKAGYALSWSNYYKASGNFEAEFNIKMTEVGDANWNTYTFFVSDDTDRGGAHKE